MKSKPAKAAEASAEEKKIKAFIKKTGMFCITYRPKHLPVFDSSSLHNLTICFPTWVFFYYRCPAPSRY